MTVIKSEDWIAALTQTEYEPVDTEANVYQSYRFESLEINSVTIKNYKEKLVPSLIEQVEIFIPPSGSFATEDLRRYLELVCSYETSTTDLMLGLSLADQIRLTFSDMRTSTICDRYPEINLAEKRRYRCVAEYLIPKLLETLKRSGLGHLIKCIPKVAKTPVNTEKT